MNHHSKQKHTCLAVASLAAAVLWTASPAMAYPPPPPPGLTQAQADFAAAQKNDGATVQNETANTVKNKDGSTTTTILVIFSDGTYDSKTTTTYPNGTTSVTQTQGTGFGTVDSVTTTTNAKGQVIETVTVVHNEVVQTQTNTYYPDGQTDKQTTVTDTSKGVVTENTTFNDTKNGTAPFGMQDQITGPVSKSLLTLLEGMNLKLHPFLLDDGKSHSRTVPTGGHDLDLYKLTSGAGKLEKPDDKIVPLSETIPDKNLIDPKGDKSETNSAPLFDPKAFNAMNNDLAGDHNGTHDLLDASHGPRHHAPLLPTEVTKNSAVETHTEKLTLPNVR